ncbi:hypothetical protein [Picrophilus oshimae]|nr:hypothetical protein [Picrophilus oshimae]
MAFFVVSNSMNNISVSSVSPNVYMESGSNYNSGGPGGVPETEFYISGINSPGEQMSTCLNIFFNYSAPPGPPGPGPGPGPAPKTTANNVIKINNGFSKNVEVCFLFNEPAYLSICYTVNEIRHPSGGPGGPGGPPPAPSPLKSGTLYNITGEYMCLSMSLSSSNEDTFPFAFIVYYNDNTAIEYRFNINLNE